MFEILIRNPGGMIDVTRLPITDPRGVVRVEDVFAALQERGWVLEPGTYVAIKVRAGTMQIAGTYCTVVPFVVEEKRRTTVTYAAKEA